MTRQTVDTLIVGAKIITMDEKRRILMDGVMAVKGGKIVAVGPRRDLEDAFEATETIDGRRFVVTPGFINGHVHITGDALTRGYLPDDLECSFEEKLNKWVIPRYHAHTRQDEGLSAQFTAVEMLRSGTTCFVEAGTIRYMDEVVEGLQSTGIRGRVGIWVEGTAYRREDDQAHLNRQAIDKLEAEIIQFPAGDDQLIFAWPLLVGHSTNTDEVWRAAKSIADAKGLGISAHMSPYKADPDWFLEKYGRRPIEHLADIGVLGENVSLTHVAHIDAHEQDLLAQTGTNVTLCPLASLKGAFGMGAVGRFPEMAAAGINIMLGTDGYDQDIMRLTGLMSAMHKDARHDIKIFPATEVLEMVTLNGAKALGMADEIGSLEVGKRADFVCHDTDRPEWRPLLNVVNQLIWAADGRSVHSVWVDGARVVDNYHSTLIDEEELCAKAQSAGEAIMKRTGLPPLSPWPVIE